ncbi:MAG TPA: hypothetical protein VMU38_04040 [Candidatus Binatia bacterium]|nr:hypothetical protein [Candidatus Binatia bacterium]
MRIAILLATLAFGTILATFSTNASAQTVDQSVLHESVLAQSASPMPTVSASPLPAGTAPVPSAPAAPAKPDVTALMKHSNPNFNPCGGWRQLLITYAAATNCSFDRGQFTLGVNYAATYVPLGTQLVINGTPITTSTYANTHAFPSVPISAGLGGRWTFRYTPPEYQDIVGYNGNVDKSGTTNQVFQLMNMFFFNRCFPYCGGFGLSAIILNYEPPTGSSAWRGTGPRYTAAFSTSVTVGHSPSGQGRWIINLYDPVTWAVTSSEPGTKGQPGQVQWGVSSTLLATAIWIHHSWRLNTSIGYTMPGYQWVWNLNPNYLLSRRFVVGANYGGAGVALSTSTGVPPTFMSLNNTTRPRFLDITLMYLLGPATPPIKGLPEPPPGD